MEGYPRHPSHQGRTRLGRFVVSDNVSLDGVIQDPAGDEGFARGGWVGLLRDRPELSALALEEARGSAAMLMGRRTYDWFAARWPSRSGELADLLNGTPKYVMSSTLKDPTWTNSTVLTGDLLDVAATLRHDVQGEILIPASASIARTLIEHDLVDELRLKVFPVVLGAGERLLAQTTASKSFRLIQVATLDGDTAYLRYQRS